MIKMPRRNQGAQGIAATAAYEAQLAEWCQDVIRLHRDMNLKIGVQEWNYIIEGEGSITKGEFEACEKLISACRKNGKLPISICADDNGRPSTNEEYIDDTSVQEEAEDIYCRFGNGHLAYIPLSFWENQKHYVEAGVEKIGVPDEPFQLCDTTPGANPMKKSDALPSKYIRAQPTSATANGSSPSCRRGWRRSARTTPSRGGF